MIAFRHYGFLLTTILGLGLATPQHQTLTFAQLDGSHYRDTRKPERSISFVGRWQDAHAITMQARQAQLAQVLDRDLMSVHQSLTLCLQAQICGEPRGAPLTLPQCVYTSGLEGQITDFPLSNGNITFTQYLPLIQSGDGGALLTTQQVITNANGILAQNRQSNWQALGTGITPQAGWSIGYALTRGLDSTLYIAGVFATVSGVANTSGIAKWDGNTWSALGTGSASGAVWSLTTGIDGSIYASGPFSTMGGVANTKNVAKWNGSTWQAMGTGADAGGSVLATGLDGSIYLGGWFPAGVSGVANTQAIAKWNGSAWSALGTGGGFTTAVDAIAVAPNGDIYVGGVTNAGTPGYVAKWNGSTWQQIGGSVTGSVLALAFDAKGTLYAGGTFSAIGGQSISRLAQWNGVAWSPVGTAAPNNAVRSLTLIDDDLYVGGSFTLIGNLPALNIAVWTGSSFVFPPMQFASPTANAQVNALMRIGDMLYVAGSQDGTTATVSAATTVTYSGTAATRPIIVISGPTTGAARLYSLTNVTTNEALYFDLIIAAGETVTLTLNPESLQFVSSFRGNIYNTILPGSQTTQFHIQPGTNIVTAFAADSSMVATIRWPIRYTSLSDALYQASMP